MPTNRKTGGIATTFELVSSHPPLESPGHHATEQLQFVNLGTPRNRGTAPLDEGLVLARSTTAGDARLNRRCRAPPPHPPKSSCHQSCLVFNVLFCACCVLQKRWSQKCVWEHVEKKEAKVIGFHETSGVYWRILAIRKRSANYRLIVTGIGIELWKESGCSTSWFPLKF